MTIEVLRRKSAAEKPRWESWRYEPRDRSETAATALTRLNEALVAGVAALVILSAFLSFSIFGGSLVVLSLQNGLESYKARLGADIIVVPNQARSHGTVDSILLQGIPGYFYMDESYLEKIAAREGVEAASPQFFLASASAGCCSVAVQIIGFDPETDFSIQPWIHESYSGAVVDGDLIVGSSIEVPSNHKLVFYNNSYNVAAQLDKTGTGLDTAVYANMNTIREMLDASTKQGFHYLLPNTGSVAVLLIGSALLSLLAGTLTSGLSARRLTKSETGLILREDA